MTIPQVNAGATDRNREQSEWIVKKLGYKYLPHKAWVMARSYLHEDGAPPHAKAVWPPESSEERDNIFLPNGSFTLCQVVGMLYAQGCYWDGDCANAGNGYWMLEYNSISDECSPHDLAAAMDALIKVLETKRETP